MSGWVEIFGIAGLLVISLLLVRVIIAINDLHAEFASVREHLYELRVWHREQGATRWGVSATTDGVSSVDIKLEDILKEIREIRWKDV